MQYDCCLLLKLGCCNSIITKCHFSFRFFFLTHTLTLTLVRSSCNYRLRLYSFLLCDIHLFYTFDYFIQSTGWKNSHDNLPFARLFVLFCPLFKELSPFFLSFLSLSQPLTRSIHLNVDQVFFFIRLLLVLPLLLCPMHILFTSMISDEMNLYDAHSLCLSLFLFWPFVCREWF